MKRVPSRILIATRNKGKIKEIRDLIKDLPVEFLSRDDVPECPEVIEDGTTFEENALKKARALSAATGLVTLADDSGLCVDALEGRPGVYSARYGGEHASDEAKCRSLLVDLKAMPDERRGAQFVCVLALASPEGEERIFRGECSGRIIRELRGRQGFGYDPVFYHEETGRTFAEMDRESKNRVSHRGRALAEFASWLTALA